MRRLLEHRLRRLWAGEARAADRLLSALLLPLELLYRGAVALRNRAYDRGWLPEEAAPVPVISVGNLVAGGSGKTPVSAWIAGLLEDRGRAPALLSRGYGEDEPALHRAWNPDVPVMADPDRLAGARRAARAGRDVAVLDDGFQHRRLRRDLDLVLVPVEGPPRERLLPRGPLREPPASLRRADWAILTRRIAPPETADAAEARVRRAAPGIRVARFRLAPRDWVTLNGRPSETPRGPLLAVTGIAGPDAFARMVEEVTGADVDLLAFPDHHPFTPDDARRIRRRADGQTVVTTEKDAVRLAGLAGAPRRVRVLRLRVEPEKGGDALVRALLDAAAGRARLPDESGAHDHPPHPGEEPT